MKQILAGLATLATLLVAVILLRAMLFTPPGVTTAEPRAVTVDREAVATHLAEAIRFRTISPAAPGIRDEAAFRAFQAWARETYPQVFDGLELTMIADHTMLLKWQGSDPSLEPVLLAAHYDVVPVVPGTEESWTHPPFAGTVSDDYIWGRGALDDKSAVIAMVEATDQLLAEGYAPARTVYFAFDHDEEIGGTEGAAGVVSHLKAQDITLSWSLDEGSFVLVGLYPGMSMPVASINVAEKGYLTLELVAHGASGHSSMPSRDASIFLLAAALERLRDNPLPGKLDGASLKMVDTVSRHQGFGARLFMANRWLFGSMIEKQLSQSPATNASMRTTTAPTLLSAGIKDNVLPGTATATVNFRIHPRDTVDEVIAMVGEIVDDDRIEIRATREGSGASRVSSADSDGYQAIADAVRAYFGSVVVVPGMTMAGTNSKHYEEAARNAYRINLMAVGPEDLAGFHGTNERISIDNVARGVAAYAELIRRGTGPKEDAAAENTPENQ